MKIFWSDYKDTSYFLDKAPYNDMILVKDVFEKMGFTVIPIMNPTQKDVINALIDGATFAKTCDLIGVYFIGHGCQIPDDDGDENDGLDEAYVCRDGLLTDDIIKDYLDQYSVGEDRMLLMADICYSGGIFDGRAITYCASDEDKPSYQNAINGIFTSSFYQSMTGSGISPNLSRDEIRNRMNNWYKQWKLGMA